MLLFNFLPTVGTTYSNVNFNTSNVTIQPYRDFVIWIYYIYFNTSNVTIQQK